MEGWGGVEGGEMAGDIVAGGQRGSEKIEFGGNVPYGK